MIASSALRANDGTPMQHPPSNGARTWSLHRCRCGAPARAACVLFAVLPSGARAQERIHEIANPQVAPVATADSFGASSAVVGDVDQDGRADFLVGAPTFDFLSGQPAAAYLFSGADGSILHVLEEPELGSTFGRLVTGVEDVDGDRVPDLVVAAPRETNGGFLAGAVHVLSGATGSTIHSLRGSSYGSTGDELGRALATPGDLDGDGVGDLLVGGLGADRRGFVRAHSGTTGAVLFQVDGDEPQDGFGTSIDRMGDYDGDGTPDFAAGAPMVDPASNSKPGYLRVVSGADRTTLLELTGPAFHGFASSLGGGRDVDGDGGPDLVVGSLGLPDPTGRVEVFRGADGSLLYGHVLPPIPMTHYPFGRHASFVGDVDADGHADYAAAGWLSFNSAGVVQVFSGQDGSLLYQFNGQGPNDYFGLHDIGASGDVTGDGVDDFALGAAETSATGTFGYVEVYAGGAGLPRHDCESKLSLGSCLPTIQYVGAPSTTGSDPFAIQAEQVTPMKNGLLFYGFGQAAIPFAGGTLCVLPPLRRTTIQSSGGFAGYSCSGTFTFDFDAHVQSGTDPLLVAGATVWAQYWFRDFSGTIGLTTALEFVLR